MSASRIRIAPRPDLGLVPDAIHGGTRGGSSAGSARADFSTSVNAYGPAPSVLAAVRESLDVVRIAAYPDPTGSAARLALAAQAGVDTSAVAIGAGATELILAVVQAFVRRGDSVLVPAHAFGEYARAAIIGGARIVAPCAAAPVAEESPSPPDEPPGKVVAEYVAAVVKHAPRIAFLCTPGSPSGRAWPGEAVAEVAEACRRAGTLLVLDQSFDAFAATPLGTPALRGHPATLHLRSLTKDHALAGIRLGYVVGPSALVAAVERGRMPWTVSAPAQAAAVAVCAPDAAAHVLRTTALLRASAAELREALHIIGVTACPSDVHYLLLDVGDAARVAHILGERHSIGVRDCTSFGLPAHIRVAARTPGDNRLLVAALRAVRGTDRAAAAPHSQPAPHA